MNILSRLFTSREKHEPCLLNPRSFLDCMGIMRECSVHSITDPDYLVASDPNFKAAMDAVVTCPYCSNEIMFGNAVKMQGAAITVECPACHTIPTQSHQHYEYA